MAWVGNLHEEWGVTLDFFIMAELCNLDSYLGGTLVYFQNNRCELFIRKDNIPNDYYD